MRFRYFNTKELQSVPVFTPQGGIYRVGRLRVCPILALQAYVEGASSSLYTYIQSKYGHLTMSLCLKCPKGLIAYTSSPCLELLLTALYDDGSKYTGGSIRMAEASATIDRGVRIDAVLNIGR